LFWKEKIPKLGVAGIFTDLLGSVIIAVGDTNEGYE